MLSLNEIKTNRIGNKIMGICPACMAEVPSLEIIRNNGTLHGFCGRCGYEATEPAINNINSLYKETPRQSLDNFTPARLEEDLLHTANALVRGGMAREKIEQVLNLIIKSCQAPFLPQETQKKIEGLLDHAFRRERNLTQEIKEFVLSSEGLISSSEIQKSLALSSNPKNRKIVWFALNGLAKEGIVEKVTGKHGVYRRMETELEDIDWLNAPEEGVDIVFPFALEDLVNIEPGNILVVAGEPNAGKTSWILNVIKGNMARFNTHLFSSEMGGGELKKRLRQFDIPLESWRFSAHERSGNFSDVIIPGTGHLNLIDFLEVYDDFYRVGQYLSEIHKRLQGGIAIVALQKNAGREEGLGGARGLEKPRLYLSLSNEDDHHTMLIKKAKNWKTETNPNRLRTDYKIINGCDLRPIRKWYRGE